MLFYLPLKKRCTVTGFAAPTTSSSGSASSATIFTHFWSDPNFLHVSQVYIQKLKANLLAKLFCLDCFLTTLTSFLISRLDRTPEGSQITPMTPSSGLSGQHVPFSFSTPHDMATNGSPRHSIASNSSGLSNPPSPGVTSHLRDSRDSYES